MGRVALARNEIPCGPESPVDLKKCGTLSRSIGETFAQRKYEFRRKVRFEIKNRSATQIISISPPNEHHRTHHHLRHQM